MTPEEAEHFVRSIRGEGLRLRRYLLEGGTRRVFQCQSCETCTQAESPEEAAKKLNEYYPFCAHVGFHETGIIHPPQDFS